MMNTNIPDMIFVGDSEMARLMRSHDWSQTPLGAVASWSASLKTAVNLCLNSRFPMIIWWGQDFVLLYNDAWRSLLGTKHPKALGRPGKQVWSEIWDIEIWDMMIEVQLQSVLETAQANWSDDLLLPVERYGYTEYEYTEEAYFTYSYSPIFLETGEVGGAFTAVTETTRRVISERRLNMLRDLAVTTVEAKSVEAACQVASATLARHPNDIPFALLYLVEPGGKAAHLVQSVRIAAGTAASPEQVDLTQDFTQAQDCWNLAQVKTTGNANIIDRLGSQLGQLSGGAWEEPARSAIVLPIAQAGQQEPLAGWLVLGISPRREFDDEYRGFFDLVASHVATAIANAHADEAERQRAENLAELRRETIQREQLLQVAAEVAQQKVETILSSISDGFYTLDRNWCFTYVNDRICTMAGKSRQELLGYCNWELFPEAIDTIAYREMQRAMRDQTMVQFEYLDSRQDRWFEHRVYPSPDGLTVFLADITDLHDRKQSEAEIQQLNQQLHHRVTALRESEERLLFALSAARMVAWEWDLQTGVNDRLGNAGEILGLNTNDADDFYQIIHPEDRATVEAAIARVIQGEAPYDLEFRLITPDGRALWVADKAHLRYDDQGNPSHLTGVCVDITDRKQAEAALRDSEERFRVLADCAPTLIWFNGADSGCEFVNQAYLDFFGKTLEEVQGYGWQPYLHPDEAEQYVSAYRAAFQARAPFRAQVRALRADGQYRWIDCYGLPRFSSSGEFLGYAGTSFDITDLKQIEAALRTSEEQLRLATAGANLGMWYWDVTTDTLVWTDQAKAMFGLPIDIEMSMQVFLAAVHPDDRPLIQTIVSDLQAGRIHTENEYRTQWVDGTVRWILARGNHTYDADGNMTSTRGVLMDITDRKQAEVEREQLLAREQAARETAEAANRIKDEFLAVVSHELRSPLNPILGWSKLLRNRQLDPQKTDRALEVIERNAQMQAQLIDDLLDVSRILRGKLSLDPKPVDLVATIQAAMETVRLAAEAKSLQIHTQFAPDVKPVAGDAGRLQQVIWNLLTNAVKFTAEGGRVDIQLSSVTCPSSLADPQPPRTHDPGLMTNYAQITVTDTGKGIPPDFLPYVFEQFRQESSTTTRRFGGLGLGLAIVRYLVELHGGTVQADSPGAGQGATFIVKLPLMPHQPVVNQEIRSSASLLDLQGTRILVVDDDDNTREFLAALLELYGAKAIITASAGEALTTLTQFKPDVLLSDIGMPDVDGYMLMQRIRTLSPEQGGAIPAIALTAYAGEIDYQQAIAAGFQRHMAKPIEPEMLVQAIVELRSAAAQPST